ncbi:GNAT family N-acetyltransferase [Uliginosibacterium sediminicola]|uniref:GNAT family N-acetyltransferase n=1 Tax=Uliginosibacterium sediminicola TaxID=2024550 RepID=A0ABU9YVL3_9RHOO
MSELSLQLGDWATLGAEAYALRRAVFVIEQGVPPELEQDEFDILSLHAVLRDEAGTVLATGRLLPDGHIGRVAVRADCRGRGLGQQLMRGLIEAARARGHAEVVLHAQCSAEGFYAALGFEVCSEVFMEAGIAHCAMRYALQVQRG